MSTKKNIVLAVGCLLASSVVLSACYEDEQGRILDHDPGVYKGQVDSPLEQQTVRELSDRARNQGLL